MNVWGNTAHPAHPHSLPTLHIPQIAMEDLCNISFAPSIISLSYLSPTQGYYQMVWRRAGGRRALWLHHVAAARFCHVDFVTSLFSLRGWRDPFCAAHWMVHPRATTGYPSVTTRTYNTEQLAHEVNKMLMR